MFYIVLDRDLSIHVPRVGDDLHLHMPKQIPLDLSIHVPRVGDDRGKPSSAGEMYIFLSTSPAWGTTAVAQHVVFAGGLSIHVPRVGDDMERPGDEPDRKRLSIHVPRVGDDMTKIRIQWSTQRTFYPRPPRGGRRAGSLYRNAEEAFLSTSPAWGTTLANRLNFRTWKLSIHVPRVGDDPTTPPANKKMVVFLSTSPAWGTTANVTEKGVVPVAICHKKTQVTNCAVLVCAICICLCCTLAQRGHVLQCERYGVFLCAGGSHPKTICI